MPTAGPEEESLSRGRGGIHCFDSHFLQFLLAGGRGRL